MSKEDVIRIQEKLYAPNERLQEVLGLLRPDLNGLTWEIQGSVALKVLLQGYEQREKFVEQLVRATGVNICVTISTIQMMDGGRTADEVHAYLASQILTKIASYGRETTPVEVEFL